MMSLIYVLWPVFIVVSAVVAKRRGRSMLGWALLGVLGGPLAVIALFVLPDLSAAEGTGVSG